MKLGYVTVQGKGRIDLLLAGFIERLEAHAWPRPEPCRPTSSGTTAPAAAWICACCPTARWCISVDRGAEARGCRLDAGALEQSILWVAGALEKAKLLVVNKFGKQESESKGLAASIADALEYDLPVLVG